MNKGDIAREAREKYGWGMPTLKLARIIYAENKLIYTNLEDARIRTMSHAFKLIREAQRKLLEDVKKMGKG